jgi:GntR family transcriptional regulator, transcriptional repressor for pyruvate dehydrogenase complex
MLAESAADRAARYIRSLIFSGQLRPGDRLPPGRDLAERLGISRVTLRLGLRSLEDAGYLETSKGACGGSRVSDVDRLLRCWTDWMRQSSADLDDILEFRTTVETRIAALAAEQRTAGDLARIEEADAMYRETRASLFRWDAAFHDAVARAAHSPRLEDAMIAVRGELFLPVDQALHEHRTEDVRAFHRAIIAAVRDGNARRAAEAMRDHIADTRRMVYRALGEYDGADARAALEAQPGPLRAVSGDELGHPLS